jgi:hypothetical protein
MMHIVRGSETSQVIYGYAPIDDGDEEAPTSKIGGHYDGSGFVATIRCDIKCKKLPIIGGINDLHMEAER